MKSVTVYEWKRAEGEIHYKKVSIGKAQFHQWGVNFEEFESGPANFSTAIIEMPDGSVRNVAVELIVFDR